MPDPRLAPSRIALLSPHLPAGLRSQVTVIWCRTTAELVVLAQGDRLRAAVIDGRAHGVDGDLIDLVRRRCRVVIVADRRGSTDWEALGAIVVSEAPTALRPLLAAVETAETAGSMTALPATGERAVLVAVLDAPGGESAATATALARSLAANHRHRATALADLTLDAPHRAVHGLDPHAPGLPELLTAARYGDPPPAAVGAALHRLPSGVLLLPGLRRHHDWVSLGRRSVQAALEALRTRADVVVAHVDHDLEGEVETGSFDVEDRNVLARSVTEAADLVVVCGSASPAGRVGLHRRLEQLTAFGVPVEQTVTVLGRRRSVRRLARAVGSLLDTGVRSAAVPDEAVPERIVPGTIGHWAQDPRG